MVFNLFLVIFVYRNTLYMTCLAFIGHFPCDVCLLNCAAADFVELQFCVANELNLVERRFTFYHSTFVLFCFADHYARRSFVRISDRVSENFTRLYAFLRFVFNVEIDLSIGGGIFCWNAICAQDKGVDPVH